MKFKFNMILQCQSSDRESGRRPSHRLRPREACCYITDEIWADFRRLQNTSSLSFFAESHCIWIDLNYKKRILQTACRNSIWFGFCDLLKIAFLRPRRAIFRFRFFFSRLFLVTPLSQCCRLLQASLLLLPTLWNNICSCNSN